MTDLPTLKFIENEPAAMFWNLLLYGPAKNGKTYGACTAPGPVLLLTCQGPASYRYAKAKLGDKIRPVQYEGRQTLQQVLAYIRAGGQGEKTIVVDTVGDIHSAILEQLGGKKPQIQHYGQANDAVYDFVRQLRDLPIHVVLVCHEQIDDSEEGGAMRRPLTGGKKLPEQVMGEVDIIAYCGVHQPDEKKDPVYLGQLVQAKGRRAGDRSGALGSSRSLDLTEWITTANKALAPDESDVPFGDGYKSARETPDDTDGEPSHAQLDMEAAKS